MYHYTLELNARLQPLDRGKWYEDPIAEALEACGRGEVDGGGTLMGQNGEIKLCDIEIYLNDDTTESFDAFLRIINEIGVPKGSFLITHLEDDDEDEGEGLRLSVGALEGLALYLNGTELPDDVYKKCDINFVIDKINELVSPSGMFQTTEISFMSLNKWFAALAIASVIPLAHAHESKPPQSGYHCPAQFKFGEMTYPLRSADVFSGPIEDRASLVPETDPSRQGLEIWNAIDGQRTFHLKCRYQGTRHYIVLEAEGATQCQAHTFADNRVSAYCK